MQTFLWNLSLICLLMEDEKLKFSTLSQNQIEVTFLRAFWTWNICYWTICFLSPSLHSPQCSTVPFNFLTSDLFQLLVVSLFVSWQQAWDASSSQLYNCSNHFNYLALQRPGKSLLDPLVNIHKVVPWSNYVLRADASWVMLKHQKPQDLRLMESVFTHAVSLWHFSFIFLLICNSKQGPIVIRKVSQSSNSWLICVDFTGFSSCLCRELKTFTQFCIIKHKYINAAIWSEMIIAQKLSYLCCCIAKSCLNR